MPRWKHCMRGAADISISVVGPFRIWGPGNEDLTPRGRKACGVIALLALSPGRRRSRAAIQDKLWSDRGAEQGAASLRQALSEIRRSLGAFQYCFVSDLRMVELAAGRVTVDFGDSAAAESSGVVDQPVLLEDLDIRDPEFEHWLRDQRTAFQERLNLTSGALAKSSGSAPRAPVGSARPNRRPWVRRLEPDPSSGESSRFLSRVVGDSIASGLAEHGAVEVCRVPTDPPGIEVGVEATSSAGCVCVRVALFEPGSEIQAWSGSCSMSLDSGFVTDAPELKMLINRAVATAARHLRRTMMMSGERDSAYALAYDAVESMFRIETNELERADALLNQAYAQEPAAPFLAWRAYLRTFYLGEHLVRDKHALCEEAEALARRALEADPGNATVLALCSYVYSFVLRNFAVGHELAEQSLRANPANPLGLASLGRTKSYLGLHEEGHELTSRARLAAGPVPYQHTLHFLSSITAMLCGRFGEAARLAEFCRTMVPSYRAPQRYLVPLYLQLNDMGKAIEAYQRLRAIEPGFSLDAMREALHPSAGLRQCKLLRFSDSDL
jgi:tetratricopeptide (TPR) repeat protein